MKRILWASVVVSLLVCSPVFAFELDLVTGQQVDAVKLLPPPPSMESPEQQRDMQSVVSAEKARTPEQTARAVADNAISVFRFDDVLGPRFAPAELPVTAKFFDQITLLQRTILVPTKDVWNRLRPFATNVELHPVGELPKNGSYPSGHSHFGFVTAIILAQIVPEKARELISRGQEYGDNRVIAGVHYPTDVEASRRVATATAAFLLANPIFNVELAAAKAEVRHALGYLK